MGSYVPSTGAQREEMLRTVGVSSTRELFRDVPQEMLLTEPLHIPDGMSELEVSRVMTSMASANRVYGTVLRAPAPTTTTSPPSSSTFPPRRSS